MKSLADRIFDLIPRTTHGLSLQAARQATGQDTAHVRRAFEALHTGKRAIIVRRGRGGALYLVHRDTKVLSCAVCYTEFTRPPKSKRRTCSRKCHTALGWLTHPENREARLKAMSASQSTPESLARTAAHNARRWADPEQHRKMSERNRERARIRREDPEAFERYRAMMRIINGSPEKKKQNSELRKQWWADPVMRKKMTDAVNASEAVQEYRKNFGEQNRRRWQDPVLREKYTKANIKRNTPEHRARSAERLKKRWADPEWRAKTIEQLKGGKTRAKAVATRKARGWRKKDRSPEARAE